MKIAVTTASGQLGSAIIRELQSRPEVDQLIGVARTPEKVKIEGIEVRKGDYSRADDWNNALAGMDAVLIVSANGDPAKRVEMHRNIINGARQNGLQKVVYTSIQGDAQGNAFSPVVDSNRISEEDVRASGLDWAIGRNGLYLEPDLDYVETYVKEGGIINCAGEGLCAYTTRAELAVAYADLLLNPNHSKVTVNLSGTPVSQTELAEAINRHFGTQLEFRNLSVEEYEKDRIASLGEFMGIIISGIYAGIRSGAFNSKSDFEQVTGRSHQDLDEMIRNFLSESKS